MKKEYMAPSEEVCDMIPAQLICSSEIKIEKNDAFYEDMEDPM